MNNDLISRKYIQEHIPELDSYDNGCYVWLKREDVDNLINNAPSVDVNSTIDGLNNEIDDLSENLAWYVNERNRLLKERRPQGEWIPVSERLPEEHGYYLVTTDGSHNAVIDIAEYGKFFRKPENEYVLEWNKASRVIAWQPLPEPYKKGGAENDT